MGTTQSTQFPCRSSSLGPNKRLGRSAFDPSCMGCFPASEKAEFHIDRAELQTHNRELVPKGKVSQSSIAYLEREEIGFLKACSGKNVSALRYYMNRGSNVNLLDEDRTSPLHVACRSGSLQVVEELINWGASVNIADMAGWTALHIAAFYQRSLVCHLLLKKGADPYMVSRNGETPWDMVKEKNTEEIFYVHFDRTELKNMGKAKLEEPPGEIVDEAILINHCEMKDRSFQVKRGIELRTGGNIVEEEKSSQMTIMTSRVNNEDTTQDLRDQLIFSTIDTVEPLSKKSKASTLNKIVKYETRTSNPQSQKENIARIQNQAKPASKPYIMIIYLI